MLEEYFKGIMILPVGNGISDGSVALFLIYIFLGFCGNDWTTTPVIKINGVELNGWKIFSTGLCAG